MMPGMTEQAINILGLKEVRRGGVQRDLITAPDDLFDPLYSTAMSLAIYATEQGGYSDYARQHYDSNGGRSVFGKIGRFLKGIDLFGG